MFSCIDLELPRMSTLMLGALLHDIGKVVQRAEERRIKHSELGAEFLAADIFNLPSKQEILECVSYHHKDTLSYADLAPDSLAYLVYEADNIAAALDRRQADEVDSWFQTGLYRPLESIFDYLNEGRQTRHCYPLLMLDDRGCINYPRTDIKMSSPGQYQSILHKFRTELSKFNPSRDRPESILKLLEATLSYVPSSTLPDEAADISLYDHQKITAAISACLYAYFSAHKINNYREYCLDSKVQKLRQQPVFLLVSGDLSGIQGFIYTIASTGALRSLRGRSFYLEILLENIVDELLEAMGFCRANLLYTGGGHFYLLLPAIPKIEQYLEQVKVAINTWFLKHFSTRLYLALAWEPCSANELMGIQGSASADQRHTGSVFRLLSEKLGMDKLRRYNSAILGELVNPESEYNRLSDSGRECQICRTSTSPVREQKLFEKELEICEVCLRMMELGRQLPELNWMEEDGKGNQKIRVFSIGKTPMAQNLGETAVPLPSVEGKDVYAAFQALDAAEKLLHDKPGSISRVYSVNRLLAGGPAVTNLWAGTYAFIEGPREGMIDFSALAARSRGIKRLAVLRADVDDLGTLFSRGFGFDREGRSRSTLSRYAAFSRWLSMFFKDHINDICSCDRRVLPQPFSLDNQESDLRQRPVVISYSGGDDLFVVGAWDQVIEFAVDLRNCLQKFTNGCLTISAGIGLFRSSFPVYRMAEITAELEKAAKDVDGKNSIALFGFELAKDARFLARQAVHCYKWDEFISKVCGEKVVSLQRWLSFAEGTGEDGRLYVSRVFLYKLLTLVRERLSGENLPLARLAYLLARIEPRKEQEHLYRLYQEMRTQLYYWLGNTAECRQLLTALYLVLYLNRGEKDE